MSKHLTETLSYRDLIARINEIGQRITEERQQHDQTGFTFRPELIPGGEEAEWLITFRSDPHDDLIDAIQSIQSLPRIEVLGMIEEQRIDKPTRRKLSGYYAAVHRCIKQVADLALGDPANWRTQLEADTPEAEILDDMIGYLTLYYMIRQVDSRGKLNASSSNGNIGASAE